jgi:hypothetical protein
VRSILQININSKLANINGLTLLIIAFGYCWRFFGASNTQEELAAVLSDQARTVRGLGRTVRDLAQGLRFPA